jgi:hypothetical protein
VGLRILIVAGMASTLAAVTATALAAVPTGDSDTTRVFERTVVCKTKIGFVSVGARPIGEGRYHPGILFVTDNLSGVGTSPSFAVVVAVNSGPDLNTRGVSVDTKRCTRTSNAVPLTRKGLPSPVPFGVSAICPTGGRVLVHLRYTYVPGTHHPDLQVGGRTISALLAIRSYKTLKAVAFVKLTAGGTKLQFSYAGSCRHS